MFKPRFSLDDLADRARGAFIGTLIAIAASAAIALLFAAFSLGAGARAVYG